MVSEGFKKTGVVLTLSAIFSGLVFLYHSEKKKDSVKKFLFENQVNFLKKDLGLTKQDSLFVVKTIRPILENPNVSLHAKLFVEYVDYYRKGTFTRNACIPAFNKYYSSFSKELSKTKTDSLYSVLNKYTFFKNFEKERKVSEIVFKRKFKNYFFEKFIDKKKEAPQERKYNAKAPKSIFANRLSGKKSNLKRFSRKA